MTTPTLEEMKVKANRYFYTGDILGLEKLIEEVHTTAKREALREVIADVKLNHKGTFTDMAGNDCWYIDDLITHLESELNSGAESK